MYVCVCLGVCLALYTHKSIMNLVLPGASSLLVEQREQRHVSSRAPHPPSPPKCLSCAGTGSREEEKNGRGSERFSHGMHL